MKISNLYTYLFVLLFYFVTTYFSLEFQQTVLSSLAAIQTTNDQILITMQEILRYNKEVAIDKLITSDNLPSFPLRTYEEFLTFEKLIKEDPQVNQYMVILLLTSVIIKYN